MPFPARSPRSSTSRGDAGPVFGVGRQLFIDCPGGREDRTPLHDDKGSVVGSLIDGSEVEVVAWMPRGTATRYLVRATHSEISGWIGVTNLRTTRAPRSAEAVAKTPVAAAWIPPQSANALAKKTGGAPRKKAPTGRQ